MTETTLLQETLNRGLAIAKNVNNVIDEDSRKSGSLNQLNKQLTFPDDLGYPDRGAGIIHWIQFTTYTKENGSLTGLVKGIVKSAKTQIENENLQSQSEEKRDLLDNADDDAERTKIESELQEIENRRSTNQSALEEGAAFLPESDSRKEFSLDSRLGRATTKTGDTVSIYLPGNINFEDSMSYEETSFAGLKSIANASARGSMAKLNILRRLGGAADIAASFVGQESLNIGQALSANLGVVVNPRKEQLFQGVSFRSFDFNFNFIPRSEKEAKTVRDIIKLFRFHAYPELSRNGAFLQFPSEFGIDFKSVDLTDKRRFKAVTNPSLPKLKRCFLEKVSTNYTPDDVYNSFRDGTAIRVEMSLTFKEAQHITRNDVNEGY